MTTLRWPRRIAVFLFVISTAVAMALYPGGDSFGGREPGFLAGSYFCDLASPTVHDGRPNPGVVWARVGVASIALALCALPGHGRTPCGVAGRAEGRRRVHLRVDRPRGAVRDDGQSFRWLSKKSIAISPKTNVSSSSHE